MHESIMIVEDEGVVALELQQCLTQLGYSVPAVVASGEEAMAKAMEHEPDLILMDIRLKGPVDGIETARRIGKTQGIPVVYLTAYSDDATVERAKMTAPFGYVLKPWEEKPLQIAIDMALYKASLETEIREQRDWYFSVLRYMGAPMIVCDVERRVRFVNASAEQLLAIEPLPDRPRPLAEILDVLHRPGASSITSVVRSALHDRGPRRRPLVLTGRGGVELPVEVTTTPIRSGEGAVLGFVLFFKPQTSVSDGPSRDERNAGGLQEYLQTELIRLLILQEQGGQATDRFIEGQLDAHRRLMQRIFGPAAVAGRHDWRREIVVRAVRDAHDQTRSILLGHAEIADSGSVPPAKLRRYLEIMVGRLVDSHGLAPAEVATAIEVGPAPVDLDRAICAVLTVNEVIQVAISTGARGLVRVRLEERGPERMTLVIRHGATDPARQPPITPVLDALVSEAQGSLSILSGEEITWQVDYPRTEGS
jgi:CheY-like chemotaxis protein/two-component sensor histidine kinase